MRNECLFKRPKDVDDLIVIWGLMDDIVHKTKRRSAVRHWDTWGIPHTKNGKLWIDLDTHKFITRDDIVTNRYEFADLFVQDSYKRIYSAFMNAMMMA